MGHFKNTKGIIQINVIKLLYFDKKWENFKQQNNHMEIFKDKLCRQLKKKLLK